MSKKDKEKDKDEKDEDDVPELVDMGVLVSEQSVSMLDALAGLGIYGVTPEEVAGRFVDERLQQLAGPVKFG